MIMGQKSTPSTAAEISLSPDSRSRIHPSGESGETPVNVLAPSDRSFAGPENLHLKPQPGARGVGEEEGAPLRSRGRFDEARRAGIKGIAPREIKRSGGGGQCSRGLTELSTSRGRRLIGPALGK
ncbi:hypothetical protein KM043_005650 [Ampulex compressa]|nr:hypothetical protein KM043_005650 [Ampulex compressa]